MIDYIIIALVLLAAFIAIRKLIKNKKNGGGCAGCSGNCSHKDKNNCCH